MSSPTAMNPLDVVQDLIRPTEEVKVAIEARSPPRTDTESDTWSSASAADVPVVHRRKILAVVSHLNADGKLEHGW